MRCHMNAELRRSGTRAADRDDIRHQLLMTTASVARHHHALLYALVPGEHCFNLTQLDPKPANLDLIVQPSQTLQ